MDPINYLGMVPQVDLGKQFLTGLQAGAGIGEIQDQAAARQLAIQQKQIAMQRASQYQSDVSSALAAPMDQQPQLFAALALRNPDQYEAINKSFGALSSDQQKNELRDTYSIASTLQSGRSDLALQQIDDRIQAHKNSGQPTADLEALRTQVEQDPKAAYGQVLHIVSGLPGGGDVLKNLQGNAESDVKVAGQQADNTIKNQQITAQKAGALAKVVTKPDQVATFLQSERKAGRIAPDDPILNAPIPTDPKALPDFLNSLVIGGMTPKDSTSFTTPTADAKLSADTQVKTTGMNNSTQLAVQDRIDARQKDDSTVKHGALGLSDNQNEALFGPNGAVTTGKLDPNRINSRTAALYADAFLKNPNMDMAKISGDIALGRNATFRQNAMTADVLPEIMQNMVDAGKKLKFSDNRTIGKMQGWIKGEVNDPDMVEYMTQRNDALMTVARVMRGAGMTDMAHKAETEVSAPTMSPDALDAWMRGQMKSLQPRLNINRKITRDGPSTPTVPVGSAHPSDISALIKKYGGQ